MKRFYTLLILLVAFVSTMFAANYTLTVYYSETSCDDPNEICIYDSEDAEDKDFIEKKKGTTPESSMYINGFRVYKVAFSFDKPIYVAYRFPYYSSYRYSDRVRVNSTATLYYDGGVFYDTLEEAKYGVHLADLNQKPEQGKLCSIGKEGISVYSSKYGNSSSSFSPTATSYKETVQGVKQFSYDVDASTFDMVVVNHQNYVIDWTKPYYYDGTWYATLKDIPINNELKEYSSGWNFIDGSGYLYTGDVYCIGNNMYSTTTLEGIGINEKSISRGFVSYCDKVVTKEIEVPAQRGTYNVTYIFNANTEEITANWEFKNSHVSLSFSEGGFFNKDIEPDGINTYKYIFTGVFYPGFYDYSLEDRDNGFVKENAYVEIPEFGIYKLTFYYDANNGTASHNVEKLQDEVTLYYVNSGSWSFVNAYVWDYASGTPQATWPGVTLTKTGKTVDGFDVYSYTFDATMANRIIFNNSDGVSGSQTDNLTFTYLKPYYYDGIWYETLTFDTNGGGTVDPTPDPEPTPTPDPNVAPLYIKLALNNWEANDTYKLTSADGNYYVANYSAGNETTISGNFKISNEDWSVNYGGGFLIEAGKSYTLTAGGANLDTAGKIKVSKVEFTLSTGVLKITGTSSSNEFDTTKDQGVAFVVNPRGTSPVFVPLTHSYNAESQAAQYTGTYTVTELGVTAKIGGLTNFNVIDYGTNGQPVMPQFVYDMVKGAYDGFTIGGDYKVGDVLNILVLFDKDWNSSILINVQEAGTNPTPDPEPEPDPTPDGEITLYYVNKTDWSVVNAYVWDFATDTPIGAWPGESATKLDKTVDGYEVYSYTFDSSLADRIIFNNGNGGEGNQTDNLTFEASKPYFYDGVWYETLTFDTNGGGTVDPTPDPTPDPEPEPDPAVPAFIVAGNGGSDATGIWCNGIEWNPSAEANRMKDADKDGIFEITYSNVPAGTWSFKVVVNTAQQQWLGGEFLDKVNSSAGYTIQNGGNIAFSLSNAADVTIKIDSADGKITLTTPSGNFGTVKIDYFSVANTDECLVENRFTAANNNTLKYTVDIQVSEESGFGYAPFRILGNCNYAVYENSLLVEVTESGKYEVTIVFNGDYETPEFTITYVKQGSTTEPDTPVGPNIPVDPDTPVKPEPEPEPVVAIRELTLQPFERILPKTSTSTVATFILENASTATVSLSGMDADFFEIGEQDITEGECSVQIMFNPFVKGVYYATLTVTTDDNVNLSIDFAATAGDETFDPGDVPELNPDPVNPETPEDNPNVSVEEVSAVMIYAKEGTVYSEVDFEIYDLAGVNVTELNGSLQGVYIIKTAEGNRLVSVW